MLHMVLGYSVVQLDFGCTPMWNVMQLSSDGFKSIMGRRSNVAFSRIVLSRPVPESRYAPDLQKELWQLEKVVCLHKT